MDFADGRRLSAANVFEKHPGNRKTFVLSGLRDVYLLG